MNVTILQGRLATLPELKTFDSGTRLTRLLVTVRQESPRSRVDVIPVVLWDDHLDTLIAGDHVMIVGKIQRRFWESPDGRRSRIEVVATSVRALTGDGIEDFDTIADLTADAVAEFQTEPA